MTNISKRLAQLECSANEKGPLYVWEGRPIPSNPHNRKVITVRWAKVADEAVRDPSKSVQAQRGGIE